MRAAEILQQSVFVLTYDLTPHGVAVRGVQLTQIKTLVCTEEAKEIHGK